MDKRKVVRFRLDNGEWRSKVYYPDSDDQEADEEKPEKEAKDDSVWSKPKYDTNKFASYTDYLMGKEKPKEEQKEKSQEKQKKAENVEKTQSKDAVKSEKPTSKHISDAAIKEKLAKGSDEKGLTSRERLKRKLERVKNHVPSDVDGIEKYGINKVNNFIVKKEENEQQEKPKENKSLFRRIITAIWGKLQPESSDKDQQFSAEAHEYTAEQLIDMLDSDVATKNIKRLSKMSREEIEAEYKLTNKFALSDDDNIEQRVNDAFLKGEGLKEITINGKTYKGLLFDENSKQSKKLNDNDTFKAYHKKYIACMKEIINEFGDEKEIDIDAISEALSHKLKKPDFSTMANLTLYDYYGLMGGTQNIKVDFKITPTSKGEYNLETTMYISDWYGADEGDINGSRGTLKGNVRGLKAFFYLQHHYDCKPFATQIIYKSESRIELDN